MLCLKVQSELLSLAHICGHLGLGFLALQLRFSVSDLLLELPSCVRVLKRRPCAGKAITCEIMMQFLEGGIFQTKYGAAERRDRQSNR